VLVEKFYGLGVLVQKFAACEMLADLYLRDVAGFVNGTVIDDTTSNPAQ